MAHSAFSQFSSIKGSLENVCRRVDVLLHEEVEGVGASVFA